MIFFVADKFRVYFALGSLFSAFLEIDHIFIINLFKNIKVINLWYEMKNDNYLEMN